MSICIAIPYGNFIHTETFTSLLDMFSYNPFPFHLFMPRGGYSYHGRNQSVHAAREAKDSHILFIDGDMTFPKDGKDKLFSHDKFIIGAMYNERRLPLTTTIKIMGEDGKLSKSRTENLPTDKIFPVYSVGLGFTLIDMKVFDKLTKPYFLAPYENGEFMTEDVYFCREAAKVGFETYCEPTIKCGHVGQTIY